MANTLKFKRGLVATIPTAALGEPLFTTDTFDLYIGNGTGNTRFQKYIASGATTQILRGDGSLYTFPLAISSPSAGQVLKYNGTSWVNDSDAGITGSGSAGQVAYFTGATTQGGSNNLFWDVANARLGVGTNVPTNKLEVVGTCRFSGAVTLNGGNIDGVLGDAIYFGNAEFPNAQKNRIRSSISASVNNLLVFETSTATLNTYNTNQLVLRGSGNVIVNSASDNGLRFQVTGDGYFSGSVGIGVSPDQLLHIAKSNTTAYSSSSASSIQPDGGSNLLIQNTGTGGFTSLRFAPLNGSYAVGYIGFINTSGVGGSFVVGQRTGGNSYAEQMRLDASGNLGLGVVPSAWQTMTGLQFGEVGSLGANDFGSSNLQTFLGNNTYYDNSGFKYIMAGHAAMYRMVQNTHQWNIASSGSANGLITFTQAMTLFATGNLGIGVTSDATYRLDVNGTMRVSGASTLSGNITTNGFIYVTPASGNAIIHITRPATYNGAGLVLYTGATQDWQVGTAWGEVSSNFVIYNPATGTQSFKINSTTNAATFSSSVTSATDISARNGDISIGLDTEFSVPYMAIGWGGRSNAFNRIYAARDATAGIVISAATGRGINLRTNGHSATGLYIASNGTTEIKNSAGNALLTFDTSGNLGIAMTPSYKLDVTGEARISNAISIGTTPDTNKPFKILKNINGTVGINFENTSTGSSAFSAIQMGTDVSGGTAFTNLVYSSSGVTASGVYQPSGTSLINTGSGGLNFLSVSQPIRFFTSTGNGTERMRITNDGDITHYNGTSPSASTTDAYRMYSADVVAGNAAPHFRTENGAVIKLYQETTGVGNAIMSLGGGTPVLDDTTFDGYTLKQVIKALRNQGILQ